MMHRSVSLLSVLFFLEFQGSAYSFRLTDSLSVPARDSVIKAGVLLYSEAKYERAIATFSAVPPESLTAPACFYCGLSYEALNDLQNAQRYLSTSVQRDSINISYRYNLGLLLAREGSIDGAITEYKRIVELDSSFFPAFEQLGQLCELWQKESVEYRDSVWSKVLNLRPADYIALYYHGVAMFRKNRPDSGIVCLTRAVEQDSLFYAAVYELGVRNLARKNIEETFKWYQRALCLRPTNAKLLAEIGTLYEKTSKHRIALPYLLTATAIDTANATYAEQTGLAYYYVGRFDSSSIYLTKAIKLDKDNWTYLLNLALAYTQMDSTRLAARALRDAIRVFGLGDGANLYLRLGNLLEGTKEYAQSRIAYERALEIDPTDQEPRFRLALMYVQKGDHEAAKKEFHRYLQTLPNDSTMASKRHYIQNLLRYLDMPKQQ